MPEIDGYETIHPANPSRKKPAASTTSKTDGGKCLAAGMSDYFSKPVNQTFFLTEIHQWLGQ